MFSEKEGCKIIAKREKKVTGPKIKIREELYNYEYSRDIGVQETLEES